MGESGICASCQAKRLIWLEENTKNTTPNRHVHGFELLIRVSLLFPLFIFPKALYDGYGVLGGQPEIA